MKIFATVGTHPQQFNRLLEQIDAFVSDKKNNAIVFAQSGNSDFVPKNFVCSKFLPPAEMRKKIAESDVVISHAGAGSIIGALEQKKPLVIVPRLKRFGEHTNDHQLDLAIAMENAGKAVAVLEIEKLGNAVLRARNLKPQKGIGSAGIAKAIKDFFLQGGFSCYG